MNKKQTKTKKASVPKAVGGLTKAEIKEIEYWEKVDMQLLENAKRLRVDNLVIEKQLNSFDFMKGSRPIGTFKIELKGKSLYDVSDIICGIENIITRKSILPERSIGVW